MSEYVDIPYECAKLVCLYAAWRILRDDNERLAAMYYNEYVDASEEMGRRNLTERYLSAEIWQQGVML